jgi:hypothetical protein
MWEGNYVRMEAAYVEMNTCSFGDDADASSTAKSPCTNFLILLCQGSGHRLFTKYDNSDKSQVGSLKSQKDINGWTRTTGHDQLLLHSKATLFNPCTPRINGQSNIPPISSPFPSSFSPSPHLPLSQSLQKFNKYTHEKGATPAILCPI